MAKTVSTKGPDPSSFFTKDFKRLVGILNQTALELEGDLVKATPTGISSTLRQAWFIRRATEANPVAKVANSQNYLLPVELGRKPGKGISLDGQASVAYWARAKLGLGEGESKSFAYLLSRKYKNQGRPAVGFIGLAKPGSIPNGNQGELDPLPGSLLREAFNRLRDRL